MLISKPWTTGACPGIRKGGGAENLKAIFFFLAFFFCFSIFQRGKVAKYRGEIA